MCDIGKEFFFTNTHKKKYGVCAGSSILRYLPFLSTSTPVVKVKYVRIYLYKPGSPPLNKSFHFAIKGTVFCDIQFCTSINLGANVVCKISHDTTNTENMRFCQRGGESRLCQGTLLTLRSILKIAHSNSLYTLLMLRSSTLLL